MSTNACLPWSTCKRWGVQELTAAQVEHLAQLLAPATAERLRKALAAPPLGEGSGEDPIVADGRPETEVPEADVDDSVPAQVTCQCTLHVCMKHSSLCCCSHGNQQQQHSRRGAWQVAFLFIRQRDQCGRSLDCVADKGPYRCYMKHWQGLGAFWTAIKSCLRHATTCQVPSAKCQVHLIEHSPV